MRKEQLLNYLRNSCYGRQNAARSKDIELALGISRTALQKTVKRLRKKGTPVCSGPEGYFYPRTAGEIYSTVLYLRGILAGVEADIRGLEGSLEGFGEKGGGKV